MLLVLTSNNAYLRTISRNLTMNNYETSQNPFPEQERVWREKSIKDLKENIRVAEVLINSLSNPDRLNEEQRKDIAEALKESHARIKQFLQSTDQRDMALREFQSGDTITLEERAIAIRTLFESLPNLSESLPRDTIMSISAEIGVTTRVIGMILSGDEQEEIDNGQDSSETTR